MYERHRLEFDRFVMGGGLGSYGANAQLDQPWLVGRPLLRILGYQERAIAMRLHGDGVSVGRETDRSVGIMSISSLASSEGCSWDRKRMLSGVVSDAKFKGRGEHEATT